MHSVTNHKFNGLILLILVLCTILLSCGIVIAGIKTHCLPLSKLVITGQLSYTTHEDICKSIMALGAPGTFMTQNINVIQQQIKQLPWINQVSVRKQWPDILKIYLVEYIPVVRWNDFYMLDNNGTSFRLLTDQKTIQSIPMLYSPKGSEKDVLIGYKTINSILTFAKFQLKTLSMSARNSWQLTLQNDLKLKLGNKDINQRLQRFIDIYPILLQHTCKDNKHISYIDLRYQSGLAVGWAPAFIDSK